MSIKKKITGKCIKRTETCLLRLVKWKIYNEDIKDRNPGLPLTYKTKVKLYPSKKISGNLSPGADFNITFLDHNK